ncbi:hypothetical protein MIB92_05005 [Aestuariirhabdus sp. Z084]|uniref:hypothetical protein n=1 Tax=Aestuariirhabdus haliotis TaxID=2918751 RepID=UPI00201B44DB|nr:hypothetical protein [Aestuariirhabdus haliotis]MCL6414999.1 hypothetical protein [Aestuariirhabdus haliotis]MCL6418931.1 hypothetical protein [Aestuariirhabdus haliotis]
MSLQQVNFYRAEELRQHPRYGGLRLVQACGLLAMVCVLIGGTNYMSLQEVLAVEARQQSELRVLTATRDQAVAELLALKQAQLVGTEVNRLEDELGDKQLLAFHLANILKAQGGGFSSLMGGLAENHLPGIWLTGFYFTSGGGDLSLQGETRKPELIPDYLQILQQAPVFDGKGFELFDIGRDAERSALMTFELQAKRKVIP